MGGWPAEALQRLCGDERRCVGWDGVVAGAGDEDGFGVLSDRVASVRMG